MKIYRKNDLLKAYENLSKIRGECSFRLVDEMGIEKLTVRQVGYLKIIAEHKVVTFSRLAHLTNNSKPTVTEMINKFIGCGCVYRERCENDGRVSYIKLTRKGEKIANAEKLASMNLSERIGKSLQEKEIDFLIEILNKIS
jgi:DNA-binding MarR family transcriptional regulator